MNQQFFTNLPSEIVIDILSRLPVRTIMSCKCVCKSWLDLVGTRVFAQSHLTKSVPGLAIHHSCMHPMSASIQVFELEDGLDLQHHELCRNLVTKLDLSFDGLMQGSANGLLFLRDPRDEPNALYICNPITRDYIELCCPQEFACLYPQIVAYGFGVSKITDQYKVVRIFQDYIHDHETHALLRSPDSECHVYTLGTRSWRRIAPGATFDYSSCTAGALLNGNLHWLVSDFEGCQRISCFDLETENFSSFSPPLPDCERLPADVFALGNCLCLCDNSSQAEIVIWSMKEYGVEESWTKEFVISKVPGSVAPRYDTVRPIKVFEDGDILMAWGDYFLFCYCTKTRTTQRIDMFGAHYARRIHSILHTPSFLSLKTFEKENLSSF